MSNSYSNPCVRCGTERIVAKTWKEKVDNTTITNTQTICPNADCQKKVEKDNKKQEARRQALKLKNEERAANRRMIRVAKKDTREFYKLN